MSDKQWLSRVRGLLQRHCGHFIKGRIELINAKVGCLSKLSPPDHFLPGSHLEIFRQDGGPRGTPILKSTKIALTTFLSGGP